MMRRLSKPVNKEKTVFTWTTIFQMDYNVILCLRDRLSLTEDLDYFQACKIDSPL